MLGLTFIKKLIVDNSDLINQDLEKGTNQDLYYSSYEQKYNLNYNNFKNITIVNDKFNQTNDSQAFVNIL